MGVECHWVDRPQRHGATIARKSRQVEIQCWLPGLLSWR